MPRLRRQAPPDNGRYAYAYAVALNDFGQAKEALRVLESAWKRQPYNLDVLVGLAYFAAAQGRRESALDFATQLRELDPENAEYPRMVETIQKSPTR